MIINFIYGLSFAILGLVAYFRMREGIDLPLKKQMPWLAAFGILSGFTAWSEMFLATDISHTTVDLLLLWGSIARPLTGLLLLRFGWGVLRELSPLPAWATLIPGILIVPVAFMIAYASTTFITPSPINIPIDIWSRYLLYLPGAILAGIGFIRQSRAQSREGVYDVSRLMLGAGLAFLFEAFVVGLIVPAAPYGPASYYNYDRVVFNAFSGEQANLYRPYGLTAWLDYAQVLNLTGFPIEFWRMLSAIAVTFFVVRGLDVFETFRRHQLELLQADRDRAQRAAFEAQLAARYTAENWTNALVSINRKIAELNSVDSVLLEIIENARCLLHADFIGLALMDGVYGGVELKCFGNDAGSRMATDSVRITNPLVLDSIQKGKPVFMQGSTQQDWLEGVSFFSKQPAQSAAVVCLNLDNQPIGALWIARNDALPYSETDLIYLECMADQAVIAIQHGLMTSQLQSFSIIEERTRIAREMHDGLAQVLGYLNLQVQTLDSLYRQDEQTRFRQELDNMRDAIRVAHADVRENILSLRTTLANEKGLYSAIHEYLNEFGIQNRIETRLVNKIQGDPRLSSVAEVQLVCILQEALTNVRKHSKANIVEVTIERNQLPDDCIVMEVRDDGIGFEQKDSTRSFGLQTMRERAFSIGGKLLISSALGEGTRVEAIIPCLSPEGISPANHTNTDGATPRLDQEGNLR
jgi:signal transduction histidine kinase